MRRLSLGLVTIVVLSVCGCCKTQPASTSSEAATPVTATDLAVDPASLVTVTEEGVRFDPPVAKAQVPKGAWYCDMGTVHYAQSSEGDATCPMCKMTLKRKR
jgi:hypothetical protein